MAVYRNENTENTTTMTTNHFFEEKMSLKAKGLLSLMFSLPGDWEYSEDALTELSRDGRDSVRSAIKELESFGYLVRTQTRENGAFGPIVYDIYETPQKNSR